MFQLNMAGGKPVYLIASSTEEYSYWTNGLQSFLAHRQANQGDAAPRPRLRIVDSLDLASDEYELDAAAHRLPARATSPAATTATPTQQLYSADVTDFDDDDELEDDAVDRPSTTPADDDANPDVYVFTDGEGDGAYYGRVPLRTPLEFRLNNHLRRAAHRLAATEQQLVELKQAHDHLEGEAAAFFKLPPHNWSPLPPHNRSLLPHNLWLNSKHHTSLKHNPNRRRHQTRVERRHKLNRGIQQERHRSRLSNR